MIYLLIPQGLAEFIDTEEEETTMIVMKPNDLALPPEVRTNTSQSHHFII